MTQRELVKVLIFTDSHVIEQDRFAKASRYQEWKAYSTLGISLAWREYVFVEDLIFFLLKELKIGPVCRNLFGLKFKKKPLWLAPQTKLEEIFGDPKQEFGEQNFPVLELRMRFRPSSYSKILSIDHHAFNYIFAEYRHDFLHVIFKHDIEFEVATIINSTVLGLISSDIIRHLLEYNIPIENLSNVNLQDFIPKNASFSQKNIINYLSKKRIKSCIKTGYQGLDKEGVDTIKLAFIEDFLGDTKKNYGAETYEMININKSNLESPGHVRVRCLTDGSCIVETSFSKKHGLPCNWCKSFEISEINFGILKDKGNVIELYWSTNMKLRFETSLEAKSFLSLLDGYYRLMVKWSFNFCSNLTSPNLNFLASIKSHGPIGAAAMISKLSRFKEPGTYLIRQSITSYDRYKVDVVYPPNSRLTFDVVYDPVLKVHEYDMERPISYGKDCKFTPQVLRENVKFRTFEELLSEVQIELYINTQPLQLKYCIRPSENDDYPLLLLSMAEEKLKKLEDRRFNYIPKSISDLPRVIPQQILKISREQNLRSSSLLKVQVGSLYSRKVILKSLDMIKCHNYILKNRSPLQQMNMPIDIQTSLRNKISDWTFVKHNNLAEIIGLEVLNYALVQEYFNYGPLDKFIKENDNNFNDKQKKVVARQMASALIYLQDKRLVHGKIRCHNIFVKSISPLQVKLSDPLGAHDLIRDRAFFPPEYSYLRTILSTTYQDSGLDVWAYGTTIWQLFNRGEMPPSNKSGNSLDLNKLSNCYILRQVVRKCWQVSPVMRIQPKAIFRDLNTDDESDIAEDYVEADLLENNDSIENGSSNSNIINLIENREQMLNTNGTCSQRSSPINSGCNSSNDTSIQPLVESIPRKFKTTGKFQNLFNNKLFKNRSQNSNESKEDEQQQTNNSHISQIDPTRSSNTYNSNGFNHNFRGQHEEKIFKNRLSGFDQSKVDIIERVGSGSGGAVYRAVLHDWPNTDGETLVAVKVAALDGEYDYQAEDLKKEFEILSKLHHVNIVKVIGMFEGKEPMLVLEYVPLGSLLVALKNTPPSEIVNLPLKKYALNIASAMEYLEHENIIHRDLALRNILLETHTRVKLCDFGLAQVLDPDEGNYTLKTDRALPLKWYAPETLTDKKFSHKTDVWSFGILLWEMYSGGCSPQYPCKYAHLSDLLKKGQRLSQPNACPSEMYELMNQSWRYFPDDRHDFTAIREQLQLYCSRECGGVERNGADYDQYSENNSNSPN